uniref:Putative secreted protein n=1 Tax=Anopheles darlingi TaxID=43151 RepID=A0A2M4D4B0_ANODA
MIFTASIWFSLASFLMSAMIFFSCCSIFIFSRSRSRIALLRARWFFRIISSGDMRLPNSHSMMVCSIDHFMGKLLNTISTTNGLKLEEST